MPTTDITSVTADSTAWTADNECTRYTADTTGYTADTTALTADTACLDDSCASPITADSTLYTADRGLTADLTCLDGISIPGIVTTGGGIRRRRRRQFVLIDGQMIEVGSQQEAIELLALYNYSEEEEEEQKLKKRRVRLKPTPALPTSDFIVYSDREIKRQKVQNFINTLRYETFQEEIKRERDEDDVLMLLLQ